mgnify:CR=1 FL=1
MSRIGKQPINIPDGVEVSLDGSFLLVKGPMGELKEKMLKNVKVEVKDKEIVVTCADSALWGLWRSLICNMITGVSEGFEKSLEIVGVGYKAEIKEGKLMMQLGFSHPVELLIPKGLEVGIDQMIIKVSGIHKQAVGQFAAEIRAKKKPEPYKGKGIRYVGEIVKIKAGKKTAGTE